MAVPQVAAEPASKYVGLIAQIAEFLPVAAALYLPGRYVVRPVVSWVLDRRGLEPTLDRAVRKLLGVGTPLVALVVGAWAAVFTGFLGGSELIVAALTLAVGFAAQDVPSNVVAGLADTAIDLRARFRIADPDCEEFSVTRSEYIRTVMERCRAAGIDLSTTDQHAISGELTVEDAGEA